MSDAVDKAEAWEAIANKNVEISRLTASLKKANEGFEYYERQWYLREDEVERLRAEVERLKVESIQMQAALGYGILAEDERHIIPSNPYKCGTCDASKHLRAQVERWEETARASEKRVASAQGEVERLRAALEWYASDVNWLNPERARAALAQEPTNDR